jgi:hypothetical protein
MGLGQSNFSLLGSLNACPWTYGELRGTDREGPAPYNGSVNFPTMSLLAKRRERCSQLFYPELIQEHTSRDQVDRTFP